MPVSKEEAFAYLNMFLSDVVEVLQKLHILGLAHMDVRLPNICFFNLCGRAVLIDLDRLVMCI